MGNSTKSNGRKDARHRSQTAAAGLRRRSVAKTNKSSEASKTIKLASDLRIAAAASTFEVLRSTAGRSEARIFIDASQVEKADAAGVQALLAGRLVLRREGKTVAWTGCSTQLHAAAALLGLASALELPE